METSKIVAQCRAEYEAGLAYKQGRVKDWQATEDQYFGRVKKTLKGRFNVPIPVMSGFVDTLHSKIDDAPILRFQHSEESEYRSTQKVQAFYNKVSRLDDNDYESLDLDGKKLAIFSGRAIFKVFAESDPDFKFNTFITDHYDFFCSPTGGGYLENHRFLGEDNIFKSKSELIRGANSGWYDKKNVMLLINNLAENVVKDNDNIYQNKANRLSALGLTATMYNFMGEGTQRFIEQGTVVDGERYHVIWNYESGLAIRCVPLKEDFSSNLWPWVSWATHPDSFNFWSKAPADDIRPVAEIIKILANQEIENRQKRNWGQRAYEPDMFPIGADLGWRPNGLVAVSAGAAKVNGGIGSGIYTFETPELSGTINLVEWLDNIIGQKSGVTAATQGNSTDEKVGIYQGNMQQVADRLGLYNKSYAKCHKAIGRRFVWGCWDHLNKSQAVQLIGEKGVEWDEIRKSDINPDVKITAEATSSEMRMSELKKGKRTQALAAITASADLTKAVNQKWLVEQMLLNGEFEDEDVRVALDTENDGNREILARASEAIEEIVKGKKPKLFRGATTAFQQKILDFALDNTDGDLDLFNRLMAYSNEHDKVVMENMTRKAMRMRAQKGVGLPPASGQPAPGAMPGQMQQPPQEMPMPQTEPAAAPGLAL